MPLSGIQSRILQTLAANRDPESYIAGSTPLNISAPRISADIDVFHDREERVSTAALLDASVLHDYGFEVRWIRREPAIYSAIVQQQSEQTRLEWVADSDFRFFPTVPDPLFGYVLHPIDLATNKVSACYGRREPRDVVDLLTIHEKIIPLGAAVWASVGKALGFTPEGIIHEIRRNARYTEPDLRRVQSDPPVNPHEIMRKLHDVLAEAEEFIRRMPTEKAGLVFLDGSQAVQPNPEHLDRYEAHAGKPRGHWPSSPEIMQAMMHRVQRTE